MEADRDVSQNPPRVVKATKREREREISKDTDCNFRKTPLSLILTVYYKKKTRF